MQPFVDPKGMACDFQKHCGKVGPEMEVLILRRSHEISRVAHYSCFGFDRPFPMGYSPC